MTEEIKKPIQFNKLMAYFLKEKGIKKEFRSCNYGYKTYDSSWKLFKEKLQIVHHKTVKCFEHGEYVNKLEETVYSITQVTGFVNVDCVQRNLY